MYLNVFRHILVCNVHSFGSATSQNVRDLKHLIIRNGGSSKEIFPSAELQTKNTDRLNHLTLHPQTKTLAIRVNKSVLNRNFVEIKDGIYDHTCNAL